MKILTGVVVNAKMEKSGYSFARGCASAGRPGFIKPLELPAPLLVRRKRHRNVFFQLTAKY